MKTLGRWKCLAAALVCAALVLVMAHTAHTQENGEPAEKLFNKMEQTVEAAKSLVAVIDSKLMISTEDGKSHTAETKTTLFVAESNKVNLRMTGTMGGKEFEKTIISDGERQLLMSTHPGEKPTRKLDKAKPRMAANMITAVVTRVGPVVSMFMTVPRNVESGEIVKDLFAVSQFESKGRETVGTREANVVTYVMEPKAQGEMLKLTCTMWIDAETGLPLKRVARLRDMDGNTWTCTDTFVSLEINLDIDGKTFEIKDEQLSEQSSAGVIKPYVALSGAQSRITEPSFLRIGSAEKWAELWQRHVGEQTKVDEYTNMEIDFERAMVVAVFYGQTQNAAGIRAVSITEDAAQITLRFQVSGYQTVGVSTNTTPYGIFVLPRSSKELVVEENVQEAKHAPPVWKERARFPEISRSELEGEFTHGGVYFEDIGVVARKAPPSVRAKFALGETGVELLEVKDGSRAADWGFTKGDIVTTVCNGRRGVVLSITTEDELRSALFDLFMECASGGGAVYLIRDGEKITLARVE